MLDFAAKIIFPLSWCGIGLGQSFDYCGKSNSCFFENLGVRGGEEGGGCLFGPNRLQVFNVPRWSYNSVRFTTTGEWLLCAHPKSAQLLEGR